jgi:ribosomal protein S18 acetylase RimI-like enzyme
MMIKKIDFQDITLVVSLFELQRASYMVEANIIGFDDIPPLKESFDEFLNCPETFLGYFEGEELAGAVSYTIDRHELTICRMVVSPNHFRKGIAQNLLNSVESNHQGILVFKVSTGKDNDPAKNLYLKNGFRLIEELEVAPNFFISNYEKRMK